MLNRWDESMNDVNQTRNKDHNVVTQNKIDILWPSDFHKCSNQELSYPPANQLPSRRRGGHIKQINRWVDGWMDMIETETWGAQTKAQVKAQTANILYSP